jgi:glycosyltransferase involved in cell wall biosynthesis
MIFGLRSTKKLFSVHYSFDYISLRNQILIFPIFLFFDSIIFCSESSKKSFPSWYLNIVRKKSSIVYNGVDMKLINKNYFGNQSNDFTLVTVSRLDNNKNLNSVINALYQLNNKKIKLRILGGGPEKNSLIKLSSSLGLESQITFYGQVERKKVYELLSSSDLFISMSKTEGHPISVLEALGAGKPTILSNISPHREIAKNDDCVKITDENHLVNSINYFREKSKEELSIISKLSQDLIKKHFSIDNMTNNYLNAYKNLL